MTSPPRPNAEEVTPLYTKAECDTELVESLAVLRDHPCSITVSHAINIVGSQLQHLALKRQHWEDAAHGFQAVLKETRAERDAARRSTAELRGALEAFKDCADTFDESTPDSFPLFSFNEDNEMEELEIELGDLRKARTALASSPPAGTDKDGLRKALGDTVIIDPEIRDGRPVLPGTGFMIADLLAEISDSAGVAEVADGFDLDAKRISNFLDALSGAINDALASSSTKE